MQPLYVFLWFEIFTISHPKQNVPSLEHNIVGGKKNHKTGCGGRTVIFYIYKEEAEEYFLNMPAWREAVGHALALPGLQAGQLDELAVMWKL